VYPGPARNAEAVADSAALGRDYGTLSAPRQEHWNSYKLAIGQLIKLDKL